VDDAHRHHGNGNGGHMSNVISIVLSGWKNIRAAAARVSLPVVLAMFTSFTVTAAPIPMGPNEQQSDAKTVYRPGNGVTLPRVVREVKPEYTAEAMREKIQGSVLIEATVTTEGGVIDAKVVRSLDAKYGLDDEALKAARQWRFVPGMKDGKPVNVLVTIQLAFTLGNKPQA
jgi:TonB family protein